MKMQLINTTDWSDRFLRRMVSWCCKELGLPVRFVKRIKFGNRRSDIFSGYCRHWDRGCQIVVSISDSESRFPWTDNGETTGIKGIVRTFQDRTECLVNVTAHELRHALAEIHGERTRGNGRRVASSERATEFDAQKVQSAFNLDRENLLSEWGRDPVKTKPTLSITEKRAAAAKAKLAEWQRKAKLAATKVKKYKQKVRYYEKSMAISANRSDR